MSPAAGFYALTSDTPIDGVALRTRGEKDFVLTAGFRYVDRRGTPWRVPRSTDRTTDLASVPPFLWGLFAPYGRQLLPALMHDFQCAEARAERDGADDDAARSAAHARRRGADLRFHEALRVQDVPPFRANVFLAAVTWDRFWEFRSAPRAAVPSAGVRWATAVALGCGFVAAPAVLVASSVSWTVAVVLWLPDAVVVGVHRLRPRPPDRPRPPWPTPRPTYRFR